MASRYKNKQKQKLYEDALKLTYPVSFEKDKIGGSVAYAWNLGYEGKVKKHPRATRLSDAWVLFYAGKEKCKIDKLKQKKYDFYKTRTQV